MRNEVLLELSHSDHECSRNAVFPSKPVYWEKRGEKKKYKWELHLYVDNTAGNWPFSCNPQHEVKSFSLGQIMSGGVVYFNENTASKTDIFEVLWVI